MGQAATQAPPAIVAGSHDPLLDWSLRESGCQLAMMPGGSLDGLERLAAFLQNVDSVYDLEWAAGVSYGEVKHRDEVEWSTFNFEVADVALFLASDASCAVTGQEILVDRGWVHG